MENVKIEANHTISGLSKSISHQPISPYDVYGERNVLRTKKYSMGCECGLGIKGAARTNETKSRIIKGYEPEKRPWMVQINIEVIL